MKAALQQANVSKQTVLSIVQSAGNIDSDHYMTEILVTAAPLVKSFNDATLKDAYRATAKKIESETYYGRALRAID
jgi:hypothetical protein